MANLPFEKRVAILSRLCHGARTIDLINEFDTSFRPVSRVLAVAGETALALHQRLMTGLAPNGIVCSAIWSFSSFGAALPWGSNTDGSKDVWTWTALERQTGLIIAFLVGPYDGETATRLGGAIARSLRSAEREDRADLSLAFEPTRPWDPAQTPAISASLHQGLESPVTALQEVGALAQEMGGQGFKVERKPFGVRLEKHIHALAVYFFFHNFIRMNPTYGLTPAMAAGITDRAYSFADLVAAGDARQVGKVVDRLVAPSQGLR